MASALSFASVAYALLISNMVTTAEQATIFTGVSNILLAALGGIMVPRFIMPPLMQDISYYSPMAWGLEGFLDLFLRQGDVMMILPEVFRLTGFGIVALLMASFYMRRQRSK
jgi:ABC-2 type transport system permease protein